MHFISTSTNASVGEQCLEFKKVVEYTHEHPVCVCDTISGLNTHFCLRVRGESADNPMQSETSGHIGSGGNRLYQRCDAGGSI